MKRNVIRVITALAIAIAVPAPLSRGDVQLVLTTGQVIKGLDVRREGANFILQLPGGTSLTLPTQTVAEVRLEGEAPPPPPPPSGGVVLTTPQTMGGGPGAIPGTTVTAPQNLSGPPIQAPTPEQQLKVFGKPSTFNEMPRNNTWTPTPAWDPSVNVNAADEVKWKQSPRNDTWTPTSAYDPNVNVNAKDQVAWTQSPRNDTWTPSDGFKREPTGFVRIVARGQQSGMSALDGSRPAQGAGPHPSAWACGERFFIPGAESLRPKAGLTQAIQVSALNEARFDPLRVPLYRADAMIQGVNRRAVFTMAGDSCRLLGGDLGPLLGTEFSVDQSVSQSTASFSSLLGATGLDPLKGSSDKLEYAFALVSLADPEVSGARHARLEILYDAGDLNRIAGSGKGPCSVGAWKRRRERQKATARLTIPKIASAAEVDTVTFWTWSEAGGKVCLNTVYLAHGGSVSIHREIVAEHVGTHTDSPQKPKGAARAVSS